MLPKASSHRTDKAERLDGFCRRPADVAIDRQTGPKAQPNVDRRASAEPASPDPPAFASFLRTPLSVTLHQVLDPTGKMRDGSQDRYRRFETFVQPQPFWAPLLREKGI